MPDRDDAVYWRDGWHRDAHKLLSPNFGERPPAADIDLIVVHSISLPEGCYGGDEVPCFFLNQLDFDAQPAFEEIRGLEVSAHFMIRRDGALLQFVSCDMRAWHAGASSWRGRTNCNDDSIGIELEGVEGETFEPAQYAALVSLCKAIASHYPIAYVAGHEHIAPDRKGDPGSGFDWPLLQRGLGWKGTMFPAGVL